MLTNANINNNNNNNMNYNPNGSYLPPLSNSGNKQRTPNVASNASNYVNNNATATTNGSMSTLNNGGYSNVPPPPASQNYINKSINNSNSSINEYQNIPANYANNRNYNLNPNSSPNYVNTSQIPNNSNNNLKSINENDPYGIGPYPSSNNNSNPYVNVPPPNIVNANANSRNNVNPSNISNYNRLSPPEDQYKNNASFNPNVAAVNSNNKDYNSIINLNNNNNNPTSNGANPANRPPVNQNESQSKEPNKTNPNTNPPAGQGANTVKPVTTNGPKTSTNGAPANAKAAGNAYSNQNKNNKSNYNNISNINSLISKSPAKNNNSYSKNGNGSGTNSTSNITTTNNNSNKNEKVIAFNTKVPPLKNLDSNKNRDFVQKNRERDRDRDRQGLAARNNNKDRVELNNPKFDSNQSDIDSTDTLSPVTYGGSIGSDSVDKSKPKNPLTLSQRDRQLGIKPKKPSPAPNGPFATELYNQYAQQAAANMPMPPRYYGNVLPVAVPYYYPHPPPPAYGLTTGYPYGFRTPPTGVQMPVPIRQLQLQQQQQQQQQQQNNKTNRSVNEKTRITAPPIAVLPYYVPPEIQYLQAPVMHNDKDPSLHDLLYYEKFKNQEGSYVSKHIEKKIRNLDGFYHPFERHTLEDYRQLKANQGFKDSNGRSIIDYDPETRDEKIEKMQKRKEMGNLFSRSNPKPKKKIGDEGTLKGAKSDGDLMHSTSSKTFDHFTPPKDSRSRATEYNKSLMGRSYQDNVYDDLNPRSRGGRRFDNNDDEAYFNNAFLQSDLPPANYNSDTSYQFDPSTNYYDD